MNPNPRLEEVLLNCPDELRPHYSRILNKTIESTEQLPSFYTLDELTEQAKDIPLCRLHSTGWNELDRVIAGGIAEGESILLAAQAGAGKTHFAVNLAINYASQGDGVCYLTMEDGWQMILRRFSQMDPEGKSKQNVFMVHEDSLTLQNASKVIEKAIQDAKLIIIDNLFALPLRQSAKGDYWQSQAEWVDDICNMIRSSNSSALILHHLNKAPGNSAAERYQVAGSTRLLNRVSQVWLLTRSDEEPSTIGLKIEKNRRSQFKGECWLKSDLKGILKAEQVRPNIRNEAKAVFNIDR